MIVHYPKTDEGRRELGRRVAAVHADMVNQRLQKLNCPADQKAALLNALISSLQEREKTPQKTARPIRGKAI